MPEGYISLSADSGLLFPDIHVCLSYEKLSAKLELMGISIHKQSLYDIENNKRTVKDFELFGLAYVLGIDVNDLLADMNKNFKK